MKLSHPVLFALGLTSSALLLPLAARAQTPSPAPTATPSVSAPSSDENAGEGKERHGMKARLAALTPEERAQLKAAREKAMEDPAVKAAEPEKSTDRRAYQKTVREAMLKADPTIKPILEKMRAAGGHHEAAGADQ